MTQELAIWTSSELDLIKKQIAPGASDGELALFAQVCKQTGLNPFTKQIYAVKRWDSAKKQETTAFQVGIDGARLIAERTGKYAGQRGPYWCGSDGKWEDVWLSPEPPAAAKVAIIRNDFAEVLWAVARYESYVQRTKEGNPTRFWKMMPDIMLAKCAESLGIRKAFPQELSGVYTEDEMGQAEAPQDAQPTKAAMPAEMITGYCEWHHKLFEKTTSRGTPYHFAGQNACDGEIIRTRDGEILYRREDIQGFETEMATVAVVREMPPTEPLDIPQGVAICQNCDAKPALDNSAYCSACEFEMFGDRQPTMIQADGVDRVTDAH